MITTTKRDMLADIERCVQAADAIRAQPGTQWELLEPIDEVREKYGIPAFPLPTAHGPCTECHDGADLDSDIDCYECGRVGA